MFVYFNTERGLCILSHTSTLRRDFFLAIMDWRNNQKQGMEVRKCCFKADLKKIWTNPSLMQMLGSRLGVRNCFMLRLGMLGMVRG